MPLTKPATAAAIQSAAHALEARGHAHLKAGDGPRALRAWRAADRIVCRYLLRRPAAAS